MSFNMNASGDKTSSSLHLFFCINCSSTVKLSFGLDGVAIVDTLAPQPNAPLKIFGH